MTATPPAKLTFEGLCQRYPKLFEHAARSNCPTGWLPLLADLCARLAAEAPEVKLTQVKDKFAALRIYHMGSSEKADELIGWAEHRSATLCENCGSPGKTVTRRGWMHVWCDGCAK